MATGWFYLKDGEPGGQQTGPVTWEQLYSIARSGGLHPDDLVWNPALPEWLPASQVPDLFASAAPPVGAVPYAGSPGLAPGPGGAAGYGQPVVSPAYASGGPEPTRSGRPNWLFPVLIPLIALIVVGGAVAAVLLLTGGHGDGASSVTATSSAATGDQTADQAEIKVEELSLAGRVTLPEGVALSPGDLAVLSDTSETSCSADGAFKVSAVHDEGARTPILVLNSDRNPVLMAVAESSVADLEPSVASTARVLVLHDPAFLSLPRAAYDAAAEQLESHARLPELESALSNALRADPSAPLDADAHPEVYDLSAQIAVDILSGIIDLGEEAVDRPASPLLLAATGDFDLGPAQVAAGPGAAAQPAMRLAAVGSGSFVDVVDDPEHTSPEVTLVNTTFAHYYVGWAVKTSKGSSEGHAFLPRNTPWRVDAGSLQIGWPPLGFKLEKSVSVGDGDLVFHFQRADDFMGFDIGTNLIALVVGAGAESIRKLESADDLAQAIKTVPAMGQVIKELSQLSARVQGQSFSGTAKEVGSFLVVNGGRLYLAFSPFFKKYVEEEFATLLGQVITRRMAAMAVLGYGSVDLFGEIRAYGDPLIASFDTKGVQLGGLYPFSLGMELSVTPKEAKTYVFNVVISGFPGDFAAPVELVMDFGDGKTEKEQPNVEGGGAELTFKHTYDGEVPKKARAVLQTYDAKPALMASREADLPVEMAQLQPPTDKQVAEFIQASGIYEQGNGNVKIQKQVKVHKITNSNGRAGVTYGLYLPYYVDMPLNPTGVDEDGTLLYNYAEEVACYYLTWEGSAGGPAVSHDTGEFGAFDTARTLEKALSDMDRVVQENIAGDGFEPGWPVVSSAGAIISP
jgi:hypothetical protein